MQLRGAGLIHIRFAIRQLPTPCIKGIAINRTKAVAPLGHDTGRACTQCDLPITGMALRQRLINLLPMGIGRTRWPMTLRTFGTASSTLALIATALTRRTIRLIAFTMIALTI